MSTPAQRQCEYNNRRCEITQKLIAFFATLVPAVIGDIFPPLFNPGLYSDLTDTPADLIGSAGQLAAVNSGETALEFNAQAVANGATLPGSPAAEDLFLLLGTAQDGMYRFDGLSWVMV